MMNYKNKQTLINELRKIRKHILIMIEDLETNEPIDIEYTQDDADDAKCEEALEIKRGVL